MERIQRGGWRQAVALVSSSGYHGTLWRAECPDRGSGLCRGRGKLAGVLAKEVSVAGVEQVTGGGSG